MKQNVTQILKDIFTSSGYRIVDSSIADLIAEKDEKKMYIKFSNLLNTSYIEDFAYNIRDGAGLIVTPGNAPEEQIEYAKKKGVIVWDREELAYQIGNAVLADIEGESIELGKQSAPVEKATEEYIIADDKKKKPNVFTGTKNEVENRTIESKPEVKSDVETIPSVENKVIDLRSAPVNITGERAISIAKPHQRDVTNAALKFVPLWKYTYEIQAQRQFRSKIIDIEGDGEGYFNSMNEIFEDLELPEISNQTEVEVNDYEVKAPIVTKEEATKAIFERIIDQYTRDVKFDNTIGEAIISEHKRISPSKKEIEMKIEMVYLPVWEAKGKRNSVDINATNGEVLLNPVDNDVEIM
ncbi:MULTISPECIES: hypothetical protein [Methanohalophilus]|jgi:hypothetical protein|uniref:Uncharacterized protein n=1 Tax=Methanohalophilus euhalobius TaxID=51203 RepID=A0A315A0E9_9EURY|nr:MULTISPECIES: hypothetical protein [Methanohalophilus]OBZ35902.1 MAG: hypothetical protein A9957_05610 [Methanohalophilus sp. DAL1]PQV42994.1 hypothetical protein B0H22_1033 [Methanohalophilus euhalobius]RNI09423.1 hypothetical protein EDD83_05630 [Methanohalophilus euhalobius]RXG33441.1 hypothetical protein CI957_1883 [Methanohalophilus sp. WG1-DM]